MTSEHWSPFLVCFLASLWSYAWFQCCVLFKFLLQKLCAMNNLRFAIRQLFKNPGFTCIAILTLALGIGANTSMFSVLNTLLLQPLPYPRQESLVRVFRTSPQSKSWP